MGTANPGRSRLPSALGGQERQQIKSSTQRTLTANGTLTANDFPTCGQLDGDDSED
jgi:hypothetical protein